ncbi:MAG TPA: 4-alpha-glucanotransferase [Acidimicrobiales bacterium]
MARRYGVQATYETHDRTRGRVSDESLVGVLAALGVPINHPDQAPELLAAATAAARRQVLEPVLVHRPGAVHSLALPAAVDPCRVQVTVRFEDGTVERRGLPSILIGPARPEQIDGAALTLHRFRLTGSLAPTPGYHRLEMEGAGLAASTLVISAPRRCPDPARGWGVFAPLHAVRTQTDWGVATYRELAELGDWVGTLGGVFVGTLPLNASFLDGPLVEPSPYRPASRLAWNELYVDIERLPELEIAPEARDLLASAGLRRRLERLRSAPSSDPVATLAIKRQVLELLADALAAGPSARRRSFEAFLDERPEVEAYARFRAATETLGRPWTAWAGAVPAQIPAGAADERRICYHRYAQWVAECQLAEAATHGGLYLDLPVGVHPDGFDPWWQPTAFSAGATTGAPPDSFQGAGQDWAVNPLHPEGVRQDGYGYPIAFLRHAMRHAAVVRIDHVMGLHRLWWIPEGMTATDGAYVSYRAQEFRAVAVLEAVRAGVAVVGEDLGTVDQAVRAAMRSDGMLRSHVHQFAATPSEPLPEPPPDSLASLGTHDLPPFAAWWAGLDIDERARRGQQPPEAASAQRAERAALRAAAADALGRPPSAGRALQLLLAHLAGGPARLVLVDLEDLWLEREPQNRPGTGPEEGNFRRRWARRWPGDLRPRNRRPATLLRLVDAARRGRPGSVGPEPEGDSMVENRTQSPEEAAR